MVSSRYEHDSLVTAHCFVDSHDAWCYGEVLIILCGIFTFIISIWCLYRMLKYQNEAKSSVRCFIIYVSIILSVLSILHALAIEGASLSLIAAFLVSFQCTLFTVFFIKICVRTNSDNLSVSMHCERISQSLFLFVMTATESILFIWSLAQYDINHVDCHSPPFIVFSCIDVAQILCTIIAVCFIKRKIRRQYEQRASSYPHALYHAQHKSSLLNDSPPLQPLSVAHEERSGAVEQHQLGQLQMLHKSHQLMLLVICIFICALVTAVYETWNFAARQEDCRTFIPDNALLNEVFRLIERITWLYMPSWLVIYVFWVWPVRPKKYISEEQQRRLQLDRQKKAENRKRILNKLCCYCLFEEHTLDETQMNGDHYNQIEYDEEQQHYNGKRRKSSSSHHDQVMGNGLQPDHHPHAHRNSSLASPINAYQAAINDDADNTLNTMNGDEHGMYHRQLTDEYHEEEDEEDESDASSESDSMRRSDVWDQHIITENIRTPASNVLSGSMTNPRIAQQ